MNFHRLQTAWNWLQESRLILPNRHCSPWSLNTGLSCAPPCLRWLVQVSVLYQPRTPLHIKYMKITVSGCVPSQKCLSSTFWCVKHWDSFDPLKMWDAKVIHLKRQGKKTGDILLLNRLPLAMVSFQFPFVWVFFSLSYMLWNLS